MACQTLLYSMFLYFYWILLHYYCIFWDLYLISGHFYSICFVSILYSMICIQYIRLFLLYNFHLYCIVSHLHCIFLDLSLVMGVFAMGLASRSGKDEGRSYDEWLWLGRWVWLGVWEGEWVGWGGLCLVLE